MSFTRYHRAIVLDVNTKKQVVLRSDYLEAGEAAVHDAQVFERSLDATLDPQAGIGQSVAVERKVCHGAQSTSERRGSVDLDDLVHPLKSQQPRARALPH